MDPYGTHQQALIAAVMRTTGPVVEFGAGYYSTPVLHEICGVQGRHLVTLEQDQEWIDRFTRFRADHHEVLLVEDWALSPAADLTWSVALVDHAPAWARVGVLDRLWRSGTQFVVVHDTEGAVYSYEPVLALYAHRKDFRELTPWTTVVSNTCPIW
jgi:hypothetical protein